jgi:hypothetical protein
MLKESSCHPMHPCCARIAVIEGTPVQVAALTRGAIEALVQRSHMHESLGCLLDCFWTRVLELGMLVAAETSEWTSASNGRLVQQVEGTPAPCLKAALAVFLRQDASSHLGDFCAAAQKHPCLPKYSRVPAALFMAGILCAGTHECDAGCSANSVTWPSLDYSEHCSDAAVAVDTAMRTVVGAVLCCAGAALTACPRQRVAAAQLLVLQRPVLRDSLLVAANERTPVEWIAAEQFSNSGALKIGGPGGAYDVATARLVRARLRRREGLEPPAHVGCAAIDIGSKWVVEVDAGVSAAPGRHISEVAFGAMGIVAKTAGAVGKYAVLSDAYVQKPVQCEIAAADVNNSMAMARPSPTAHAAVVRHISGPEATLLGYKLQEDEVVLAFVMAIVRCTDV